MSMDINRLNYILRKEFREYKTFYFEPSNKVLASIIGIGYSNFMQWQKGKIDLGYISLSKIQEFLNKYNKQ